MKFVSTNIQNIGRNKTLAGLLYSSKCLLLYFSEIYIVTKPKCKSCYIGKQLYQSEKTEETASFIISNKKVCMKNRVRSNQVKQKVRK